MHAYLFMGSKGDYDGLAELRALSIQVLNRLRIISPTLNILGYANVSHLYKLLRRYIMGNGLCPDNGFRC